MKQPQSKEAVDKMQTNTSKEQTNIHTRAKRELCIPHYLEDFVTSIGNHRWAGSLWVVKEILVADKSSVESISVRILLCIERN